MRDAKGRVWACSWRDFRKTAGSLSSSTPENLRVLMAACSAFSVSISTAMGWSTAGTPSVSGARALDTPWSPSRTSRFWLAASLPKTTTECTQTWKEHDAVHAAPARTSVAGVEDQSGLAVRGKERWGSSDWKEAPLLNWEPNFYANDCDVSMIPLCQRGITNPHSSSF